MTVCLNPDCQNNQSSQQAQLCQKCGAKLLLGDRYRAIQPIGQGGFGRTFLAVDEHKPSNPRCVIKQFFLQDRGTGNVQKASELFGREAVRLDELGKHPQIPELLAYFTQDGRQYLVQEFIDGDNLDQELEAQGAFTEAKIVQVIDDLLLVLEFIHSHQVIHRDIKPENIIRRREDGQLILVDFGACKLATETAARPGTVIGSVGYVAPEQAVGQPIFASDLYSLGVTCVHLLTGIHPFYLFNSREGIQGWRNYLGHNRLSSQLDRVLDKLVEIAIPNRYQSAAEVLTDLQTSLFDSDPLSQVQWQEDGDNIEWTDIIA